MTSLRISELAAQAGVPATTLRYYERVGLPTPDRAPSGYRVYSDQSVERLRFISAAKRMHLSLDSIRELLPSWQEQPCQLVKARLRPMVLERLAAAERSVADLQDLAAGLRAGLSQLGELPDRDERCDPSCAFLDQARAVAKPPGPAAATDGRAADAPACSLSGDHHRERLRRWHALLADSTLTKVTLGVTATLPASDAVALVELVTAEQRCCPFLGFELVFRGPDITLTVAVPDAASLPFVHALIPESGP